MTIKEIKEMSNAKLIEKLCYYSGKETKESFQIGKKIVKELQRRQIINNDDIIRPFVD